MTRWSETIYKEGHLIYSPPDQPMYRDCDPDKRIALPVVMKWTRDLNMTTYGPDVRATLFIADTGLNTSKICQVWYVDENHLREDRDGLTGDMPAALLFKDGGAWFCLVRPGNRKRGHQRVPLREQGQLYERGLFVGTHAYLFDLYAMLDRKELKEGEHFELTLWLTAYLEKERQQAIEVRRLVTSQLKTAKATWLR